ncbi:MAG TPA: hypothetical protein VNP20_12675 [Nocardioidaceae bacterium]|nr:hypothetical protein [Nocardioidaceae bacterium]
MLRRLATTAACALALTVTDPALARADTRGFIEVRGDVWSMDDPSRGQHTRVPNRRQGDIRRTFFSHRDHQVIIRTKFAELARKGGFILMATKLQTNTGLVRRVFLTASPFQRTHQWRGLTEVNRPNGTAVDCGATHRIDYTQNVVRIRVPRVCLNDPRSVRASLAVAFYERGGRDVFTDNPLHRRATVHLPPLTAPIRH